MEKHNPSTGPRISMTVYTSICARSFQCSMLAREELVCSGLAMLLSQGEGPLVFDQPEDEVDSNFVYRELVSLLRRIKNERQVVLVTHNANLPVNGDAEMVYALETRDGRGRKLAEGGLDNSAVSQAVLEIMEGSEGAFKRRHEKYHF